MRDPRQKLYVTCPELERLGMGSASTWRRRVDAGEVAGGWDGGRRKILLEDARRVFDEGLATERSRRRWAPEDETAARARYAAIVSELGLHV